MAKKQKKQQPKQSVPIFMLAFLVAAMFVVGMLYLKKVDKRIDRYKQLSDTSNQACVGLGNTAELTDAGLKGLNARASLIDNDYGQQMAFSCLSGLIVEAANIHGKDIGSYELGAHVSYFENAEQAKAFAEEQINPLRYWGIDQAGQEQGIPQSSLFTFIIAGEKDHFGYYDGYSVKDNAVVRISMPCPTDPAMEVDCHFIAQDTLRALKESIKPIQLVN